MFGKAVKFRHCPATVSATTRLAVDSLWQVRGIRPKATGIFLSKRGLGRRYGKAQVRRPVLWCHSLCLRSEGNGGYRCLFILTVLVRVCLPPYKACVSPGCASSAFAQ